MPKYTLADHLLLPELEMKSFVKINRYRIEIRSQKKKFMEICPRCANPSTVTYDHRTVKLRDAPIRAAKVTLYIRKRRLWCKLCKKPFTEPVGGVRKGKRTTERFKSSLFWACETFTDLSKVRAHYSCSSDFLYKTYYEQAELKRRMNQYPWPKTIGIDEHSFKKHDIYQTTQFASMIVDFNHSRVMEVVEGKSEAELKSSLEHIPGRENVKNVALDMSDPFKNFATNFFPNAQLVADKFHVIRLLTPHLLRKRKEITGTRADLKSKKYLLMSAKKLDYFQRKTLYDFLNRYPIMKELYLWKESIHGFYRIKGYNRACYAFQKMIDRMAHSKLPEIKTLRRTFVKWKNEILNYFKVRITNGKTEGFNNKAKLVKKRGYGYKNFQNYRLRLLHACS